MDVYVSQRTISHFVRSSSSFSFLKTWNGPRVQSLTLLWGAGTENEG